MRTLIICGVLALCGCASEETPPQNVYQSVRWSEVEASLPKVEGARSLERRDLGAVLGSGLCLDGEGARARLERALAQSGWRVTSAEALGEARLDVTAEKGALVLAGSLTSDPTPGCSQGFVYTVRKAVAP
jgi:hypothetical protein